MFGRVDEQVHEEGDDIAERAVQAARALHAAGAVRAVVTAGAAGAALCTADGAWWLPAQPVERGQPHRRGRLFRGRCRSRARRGRSRSSTSSAAGWPPPRRPARRPPPAGSTRPGPSSSSTPSVPSRSISVRWPDDRPRNGLRRGQGRRGVDQDGVPGGQRIRAGLRQHQGARAGRRFRTRLRPQLDRPFAADRQRRRHRRRSSTPSPTPSSPNWCRSSRNACWPRASAC